MFNTKLKKHALVMGLAGLALAASQSSMAAFVLVPNGDFSTPAGANWGVEPGGGSTFNFPTSGGNGGGYLQMDNTSAAWGGVAISTDDPAGALLGDFGVSAGGTYTFQWDQLCESGGCGGMGIKIESWSDTGVISDTGDLNFSNTGTGIWETFSTSYTIEATATRLKVVLLGINADSVIGYDNVGIDGATVVPVPAAVWLFGSGLLGLIGVARKKKA